MIRELFQLVHSAIRRDRIRIPPSEGRLLRLSPPCVLAIGTETFSIVSRTEFESDGQPGVRYSLEAEFGKSTLIVELRPDLRCIVTLESDGFVRAIAEDDIIVFG